MRRWRRRFSFTRDAKYVRSYLIKDGRFYLSLLLFTDTGKGYALVNKFPISRLPVTVSADKSKGWNDIIRLESGGGAKASYVRHRFNGKKYVKRERVPADKAPEGKR